jgi:Tfp pilus assembly protein FimT
MTFLAIIGVLALAVFSDWYERRQANHIDRRMDELMGRKDQKEDRPKR